MKKRINFYKKNLNILELNKKNKKEKIKILIKVYEKSNDKKYDVYVDMLFDVKSMPQSTFCRGRTGNSPGRGRPEG